MVSHHLGLSLFPPCFLFPLHLLLYLSRFAPSPAVWESAGMPASQHFILCVTVGVSMAVFAFGKFDCVYVCESARIVIWTFKTHASVSLPSDKTEGFIMFRVSREVEYNHSVIPVLCGQLRPLTTQSATQCHRHRVSMRVEEDCKEVSQHRFMSEIEI